jgi:hypothetical protein
VDFVLQLYSQKLVDLSISLCRNATSDECMTEMRDDLETLDWLIANLDLDDDTFSAFHIVQILYDGTSLGESIWISLEYYSVYMTKDWPSLITYDNIPVTAVDSIDLTDVLFRNQTLNSIALGVMSVTIQDKTVSDCVRLNSTCHVPTPSLFSTIFVTSPPSFDASDLYSSTSILSNPFSSTDLSVAPETPRTLDCLNYSSVHLDCSNSTRFGYVFETDLTCPGLVDEFVLDLWQTTCPVYLTTGECVSPCGLVELLPGVTTCECPEVTFEVDSSQEIGGDVAKEANYATFRSNSLLSIVYSINVEIYPELEYIVPEITNCNPSRIGS